MPTEPASPRPSSGEERLPSDPTRVYDSEAVHWACAGQKVQLGRTSTLGNASLEQCGWSRACKGGAGLS